MAEELWTLMPGALEVLAATRGAGVGVLAILLEDEDEAEDLADEEVDRALELDEARVEEEEDEEVGVEMVSGSSSVALGRGAIVAEVEG